MKFANVGGTRQEAEPGMIGVCPVCGDGMIAKCGQHRIWHWAHRCTQNCDRWWEPETPWHRQWKNQFPIGWQERVHRSDLGEKHVADVKTDAGTVIEFQHSFLCDAERRAREAFYPKMVWVVDGRRRARDMAQFLAARRASFSEPPIVPVIFNGEALLRDWGAACVPVYFDFGESGQPLWRRDPHVGNGVAYFSPVPKSSFVREHVAGEPFEDAFSAYVDGEVAAMKKRSSRPQPLRKLAQYMARRRSDRPRF